MKKMKNLYDKNLNLPWLFLSLEINKRSIDLYFDNEEHLITWFYGLSYFVKANNLSTKIPLQDNIIINLNQRSINLLIFCHHTWSKSLIF